MEWRFWKWKWRRNRKSKGEKAIPPAKVEVNESPGLSKPYAQRQIIALQRTVGNQAVLRWLGVRGPGGNQS
jgi:hypothetical protein